MNSLEDLMKAFSHLGNDNYIKKNSTYFVSQVLHVCVPYLTTI